MRRLLVILGLAAALGLAWTPWADRLADEYTSQWLAGAATGFAVARSLNAVISMLKDSEVHAGVGVSGTLAVGEVMDPLHDMVERFSEVAFTAVVALTLQKLLITVAGHTAVNVLLTVAAVLLAGHMLWPAFRDRVPHLAVRGAMVVIAVRFGMVVIALANQGFYEVFLEHRHMEAAERLRAVAEETARETEAPLPGESGEEESAARPDDSGLWSSMRDQARQLGDLGGVIDRLERAIEDMTTLILVFVLNAMVMPILLLWGFVRALGWLWGLDPVPGGADRAR